MKAIILAAGRGERMSPLTQEIPKPILKVKGKPIVDYIFEALPENVSEVVVVVKYLSHKIKEYLGSEFKGKQVRFVDGSERGTAYSFLATKEFIGDEKFLLLNGDELPRAADIANCLKKDLSVIVFDSHNPRVHGMISLRPDRTIAEIKEKPENWPTNVAAGGIYVLNKKIFDYQPSPNASGEYYFASLLSQFVKNQKVWAVTSIGFIGDLTTPEDLKRVEKLL